jgi:hypothetical protein
LKRLLGASGLAAALAVAVLSAAEKPPDDYVKAMKDLARFAQAMMKPDADVDFAQAKEFVPIVRDAFGVVERYWLDRNQAGEYFTEVNTAIDAIKIASDMGVAANLQSPEGVSVSAKDILTRCQPCHDKHREKTADGGYLIKLK